MKVWVDDNAPIRIPSDGEKDMQTGQRWILNRSFPFQNRVKIKLWDAEDIIADNDLGEVEIEATLKHRATGSFTGGGILISANYTLWYEVIQSGVDPAVAHQLDRVSLRQMLGRMGRGVLTPDDHAELIGEDAIYQCAEVISLRDTLCFHASQDQGKGDTNSVRTWINRHCNPWGEESVIPLDATPQGQPKFFSAIYDNWVPVKDEQSYCVAGFQLYSRHTNTDWSANHETMDWNWDQVLDPAFTYMLNYCAVSVELNDGTQFPTIEHIFDIGHAPVHVEIHPAHTIVREHTTAAPMGNGGAMVPVNRAIIGMGLSGGFPLGLVGGGGERWDAELDGVPDEIGGDTENCWPTNLKRHPLKFKLFPPVPRPSDTAVLTYQLVLCEYIQVPPDQGKLYDFLELCQYADPAAAGLEGRAKELAFRVWDRDQGLPAGFVPQVAPAALRPKLTRRRNAYFDVEVDLAPASQIPVGYYAIVECGWDDRGEDHQIYQFDVTFEELTVHETEGLVDDEWRLYYGVNGQWAAWWAAVDEGATYDSAELTSGDWLPWLERFGYTPTGTTTFRVWTIDNMPLSIRDCGIEHWGFDFENAFLDRVEITAPGPDHFGAILNHDEVSLEQDDGNVLTFRAKGTAPGEEATVHEWKIKIERSVL
jgi:hypothetical protein